ncbi:hypothetical protein [Sulfurimonas sp. HSL3-2]|uniref:hypothetical protein n=1 Tax=Hydrocurvibacter mobilis TaxID=3131936 RepID=UPI0031F92093
MEENELNNSQCDFSLQTSTLVCIPDKDFIHIQLQTINTADSKNNVSKSANNSLHALQRKCPWGIRQRNPKEEVA